MGGFTDEIEVDATLDNLDTVNGFVEEALEKASCPMKEIMKILVSVEEIYVNVASYAYGEKTGKCWISFKCETTDDSSKISVKIRDKGYPFDPLQKEEPDTTLSADERPIGGLGILMVKKSMDNVYYQNLLGENILTMEKNWQIC